MLNFYQYKDQNRLCLLNFKDKKGTALPQSLDKVYFLS